jgi:hypothetical protein
MLLMQLYPLAVSQFVLALPVVQECAHVPDVPDTHRYPVGQAWVEAVQVLVALHIVYSELGVAHVGGVQVVCSSQASLPLHFPVFPQTPLPWAAGQVVEVVVRGGLPLAIFEQVPTLPDSVQLWQPSVQAVLQQNPSTQCPWVQSVPSAHPAPSWSLSPQWWLGTVTQALGARQSLIVWQVVRQAEPEPHI